MSSFIQEPNIIINGGVKIVSPVADNGATSQCFVVEKDGKQYFLKLLRPDLLDKSEYRVIFKKEYEIGQSVNHRNIVKYEEFCDNEHDCYILSEYVCGETLAQKIKSNPEYFNSRANLDKFLNQLLDALRCLHENHVVYSDLNPENIMLTQVGNDVKLIDLGYCFSNLYTNTAGATEGYSAPEHENKEKLDITTDIYCVGKIIEYIGLNITDNLPNIYAKIMVKCTKERHNDRFQDTDEIVRLINRRRHIIRKSTIAVICCVVTFLAIRTIIYTEVFNSWWDSFEIITTSVEHDTQDTSTLYRILCEKDRTCEVVGHTTNPNAYINPTTVIDGKTYRVVKVADEAFANKSYLRSVYICEGVETIGVRAFRHCSNLVSVTIPSSVKVIKNGAFFECRNLTSIKLPAAMT